MLSTKLARTLIVLLLPATVWLFYNTTVNRHIHVLSNGYVISHSHPFEKPPGDREDPNPHHHTKKELFLLDLFYMLIYSSITILAVRSFLEACPKLLRFRISHFVPARKYFLVYHYHAPPFTG